MLWARAAHSGPEDALLSSPRLNKTRLMQEKVANLRQTCLRVGLPASGTKPQIVERLLDLHRAAKQSEGGAGEAGDLSSSPGDPTRTPISAAARAPGGAGTPALPWQPGPATAPPPPSSAPPSPAPGAPFPSHLPPADPFSVTWLGTSSGSPSVRRNVSCLGVRWGPDASYLVDCGEGSAAQLHAARWDLASVRAIMITHAHGDHCFGLPGVLQAVDEVGGSQSFVCVLEWCGGDTRRDSVLLSVEGGLRSMGLGEDKRTGRLGLLRWREGAPRREWWAAWRAPCMEERATRRLPHNMGTHSRTALRTKPPDPRACPVSWSSLGASLPPPLS